MYDDVMPREEHGSKGSQRVLVVEDDQSVRRMLRFSLKSAGFEILEVSTGGDALQTLNQDAPEAIILDLGLPDGLGGSVLEWLRRSEAGGDDNLVWVVISAQDQADLVSQYGPLGRHFLAKPFNPWELVSRIQELMASQASHQIGKRQ
jgi:two-component system KDP operon response regulator KdpE